MNEKIKKAIKEAVTQEALQNAMEEWTKNGLPRVTKAMALASYDEAAELARDLVIVCEKAVEKWNALEAFEWK